jgi:hypothetical protein
MQNFLHTLSNHKELMNGAIAKALEDDNHTASVLGWLHGFYDSDNVQRFEPHKQTLAGPGFNLDDDSLQALIDQMNQQGINLNLIFKFMK